MSKKQTTNENSNTPSNTDVREVITQLVESAIEVGSVLLKCYARSKIEEVETKAKSDSTDVVPIGKNKRQA